MKSGRSAHRRAALFTLICIFTLWLTTGCPAAEKTRVRLGYFPNLTHSQALIGVANGAFSNALGKNVELDTKTFNAGPSVIEAMFAGELDIAYIGPNPAINGYIKSGGEVLKIVAGATSGGAALVVRSKAGINSAGDFHGKKIASPQLGNTQDVALRSWLKKNNYRLKEKGGDVEVIPVNNPDQLTLFLKKEIDGAWTVEPWVSRLIKEGGGRVFLEEKSLWPEVDFVTAQVIVSSKFLREHPDLLEKFLRAHIEQTIWINSNIEEAKRIVNSQIRKLTGKPLGDDIINEAFKRIWITYDPVKQSLFTYAQAAYEQGFLGKDMPDLSGIYDLTILNRILKEKELPQIEE
jgi:NitT/TauT family transport system substrate-binding protein